MKKIMFIAILMLVNFFYFSSRASFAEEKNLPFLIFYNQDAICIGEIQDAPDFPCSILIPSGVKKINVSGTNFYFKEICNFSLVIKINDNFWGIIEIKNNPPHLKISF